jgi:hypothetical protein
VKVVLLLACLLNTTSEAGLFQRLKNRCVEALITDGSHVDVEEMILNLFVHAKGDRNAYLAALLKEYERAGPLAVATPKGARMRLYPLTLRMVGDEIRRLGEGHHALLVTYQGFEESKRR